ncbi:MAG: hypothetical protein MK238_08885 [Nitrospinales bacterium]|nr:hypothetical protein [Nitrospinales bacterium]
MTWSSGLVATARLCPMAIHRTFFGVSRIIVVTSIVLLFGHTVQCLACLFTAHGLM